MPKNVARTKNAPRFSQVIGGFLAMLDNAVEDYKWNYEEVNRMDSLTQDYLHKLELEELTYQERAKIATALKRCRRARRASKDTVETLTPLIAFLETEKGKNLINLTREILGQTRKVESRMETRTYFPRVLGSEKE